MSDEFDAILIDLDDLGEKADGEAFANEVAPGEYELSPGRDQLGDRLDRFVASQLPDFSRTFVQQVIEDGHVTVDGVARKPKFKVTPGEVIRVAVPPAVVADILPEPIPLDVVYEDDDLLVINKPAGMVVHPAPGHPTGTLVNALLHHVPGIAVGGVERPGIVHRLDKDTSGLMVVAKSNRGLQSLVEQWNDRDVFKGYLALVNGQVDPNDATIDAPIGRDPNQRQKMAVLRGGREAVTHFTVSERFDEATLLDVVIDTGRTHQIRVHLAFIGHPVIGDTTYGPSDGGRRFGAQRQMLHAARLDFARPDGTPMSFVAPLPEDMEAVLGGLRHPAEV